MKGPHGALEVFQGCSDALPLFALPFLPSARRAPLREPGLVAAQCADRRLAGSPAECDVHK